MKQKIIELYKKGNSAYNIMNMLDISSKDYVYKILKNAGVTRNYNACHKPLQRKTNFFSKIDNEEKAYWLGFLYADGCVHSHNNGISLVLQKKDVEHLYKYKEALGLINKLQDVNTNTAKRIEFSDIKVHADLIKQGCIPKKSLILQPPKNVPKKLEHHFMRGIFDGDGCIHKRNAINCIRFGFDICGSKDIIKWLKTFLKINNKVVLNLDTRFGKNGCYRIATTSLSEINRLYNVLYQNATIYLSRKKEIFDQACVVYQQKLVDNNRAKTEKAEKVKYEKKHGKICTKCKKRKPISFYYKHYGQTYDGLGTICRECKKILYYS